MRQSKNLCLGSMRRCSNIWNLSSSMNKSTVMDVAKSHVMIASQSCDYIWKIAKM